MPPGPPRGRAPPFASVRLGEKGSSVRQRIENYIYPERIRDFLGEVFEIIFVFAFALPTVAVVGVVRGDDHHAALVVVDGLVVHGAGVAIVVFPSNTVVLTSLAGADIRDLALRL